MWLVFLAKLSFLLNSIWVFSVVITYLSDIFGRQPSSLVMWLMQETRALYLPTLAAGFVFTAMTRKFDLGDYFSLAMGLLFWITFKDYKNDDRWKKRRKKATEAIKRVGSRLVAVPVTQVTMATQQGSEIVRQAAL